MKHLTRINCEAFGECYAWMTPFGVRLVGDAYGRPGHAALMNRVQESVSRPFRHRAAGGNVEYL